MGEVRVTIKSAFGLKPGIGKEKSGDPYVRLSLLDGNKNKVLDSFNSSVMKSILDPDWDEDFIFQKVRKTDPGWDKDRGLHI